MKKCIIQIPCYNEEAGLPATLADLPRELPGFDTVEWLIVNDGSTDRTIEVARENGVHHVVDLVHNHGLAKAFMAGIEACLRLGADVIVNTDADNQYHGGDIVKLVEPVVAGTADMVVGARPIGDIEHFSPMKKLLQKLGSWVVRAASGTDVADAPSGFRAISRKTAMKLNVFDNYTYTLDTIIQASRKNIRVASVPVRVNGELRPSRLVKSVPAYVKRSVLTIARVFMTYRPLRFFVALGLVPFSLGFLLGVRWLVLFFMGTDRAHVPSLVLAAILLLSGFILFIFGLLADLSSVNRRLLEDIQHKMRQRLLGDAAETKDEE